MLDDSAGKALQRNLFILKAQTEMYDSSIQK